MCRLAHSPEWHETPISKGNIGAYRTVSPKSCVPAMWGEIYNVDMVIEGPVVKRAPVRTGWIYRSGEDFPRLTTLYVKTTEWRRMEREDTI